MYGYAVYPVGGAELIYNYVHLTVIELTKSERTVPRGIRPKTPGDINNGHFEVVIGVLGMGCGEDWVDFNFFKDQ